MKWVAFLAFAGLASAQARIEGRVVDSAGAPVPRAMVVLAAGMTEPAAMFGVSALRNGATATSSDDGTFALLAPAGSNYRLAARRQGYLDSLHGATRAMPLGTLFGLRDGETVRDVALVMTQQAAITGRITDQVGDPVPRARVNISTKRFVAGARTLVWDMTATADELGVYRLADLPPGRVLVWAADPSAAEGGPKTEANLDTDFGNVVKPDDARVLELVSGGELDGIDIQMRRTPVFTVRGKVVDAAGTPLQAQVIDVRLTGAGSRAFGNSDAEGVFTIPNLFPGMRQLGAFVRPASVGGVERMGSAQVTLNGDLEGLVIRVDAPIEVEGRIVMPGAAPPRVQVTLDPSDRLRVLGQPSKEDGSFVFRNRLTPGLYRVGLRGPEPYAVLSVRFNGSDVRATGLDLSKGGGELEIVLSDKPGEITGTIAGGRRDVLVTVWPERADKLDINHGVRTASIDQNGVFRIGGLAPGVYRLAAWDGAEEGLLIHDDFRARFASDALRIEIAEGSRREGVEAPLIPAERIAEEAEKLP